MFEVIKQKFCSLFNLPVCLKKISNSNLKRADLNFHKIIESGESSKACLDSKNAKYYKPILKSYPKNLEERRKLSNDFQIGDIVVTHITGLKDVEKIDPFIMMLQRLVKFLGFSKASADHTIVHVAIVVEVDEHKGQILISEAMPSKRGGLRTVDLLTHHSCELKPNTGYSYQILRPTNDYFSEIAKKAAQIGKRVAPKTKHLKDSKEDIIEKREVNSFSVWKAFKGMFKKFEAFDWQAKKSLFKGIFDEYTQSNVLIGGSKPKKVSCSLFLSHLFQKVEAQKVWNQLVINNQQIKTNLDELIKSVDKAQPNAQKKISKWALEMAIQNGEKLDDEIKDFKYTVNNASPQDIVEYIKRNKIFRSIFEIIPPKLK